MSSGVLGRSGQNGPFAPGAAMGVSGRHIDSPSSNYPKKNLKAKHKVLKKEIEDFCK